MFVLLILGPGLFVIHIGYMNTNIKYFSWYRYFKIAKSRQAYIYSTKYFGYILLMTLSYKLYFLILSFYFGIKSKDIKSKFLVNRQSSIKPILIVMLQF